LLACLPDNRWLKVETLLPLLKAVWPRLTNTRWEYTGLLLSGETKTGLVSWPGATRDTSRSPGQPADWQLAQWNFIVQLITGPLHWLGLVDLYEDNGQPVEIRLHGLADLYWDRAEVPDCAPSHPQANRLALPPRPCR
jgi:hypothetical protein